MVPLIYDNFKRPITIGLPKDRSLSSFLSFLDLDLSNFTLSSKDLMTIFQWVSQLTCLKVLRISARRIKSLKNLNLDLKRMANSLIELALDFTNCIELTTTGISSFLQSLSCVHTLRQLSLNFNGCSSLRRFPLDLHRSSTTLTSIVLTFENCIVMSDKGMSDIFSALWRLEVLSNAELSFMKYLNRTSFY
eukprot:TRINITY_DN11003_c0_g1_i1.p1 TRINITY_DN11003_c0_g1~~TRINITY_DN11003_c0_g1_i1.p1  ORF type:complete len:191 (+),score=11.57 TRINITY_DN11003_c0_g1_i1:203-775(+)